MVNQRYENKLQAIQPETICKYAIIVCVWIFSMVLALRYYYNPLEVSDGRSGFYANHCAESNSSVITADLGGILENSSIPNKTLLITAELGDVPDKASTPNKTLIITADLGSVVENVSMANKTQTITANLGTVPENYSTPNITLIITEDLGIILEKASMPNKTLIITTINAAWAEQNSLLDLYLQSFRIGEGTQQLMKHILLVAVDQKAFERCQQIHPHCYLLLAEGSDFSGEKVFMTKDYLNLMWARILFLKHVLALGYSFVFSDADILWFRNPFQLFDEKADFQIACDNYVGNPHNLSNAVNGGFNFVRSNERSIKFYEWWYDSRRFYPNMHDQSVFNEIKSKKHLSEIGLNMLFLDTKYFSGFCEQRASREDVFTMHANCCIGMKAKIADLTLILEDWTSFHSPNANLTTDVHWRAPDACFRPW